MAWMIISFWEIVRSTSIVTFLKTAAFPPYLQLLFPVNFSTFAEAKLSCNRIERHVFI
jgi:hypothetical protein